MIQVLLTCLLRLIIHLLIIRVFLGLNYGLVKKAKILHLIHEISLIVLLIFILELLREYLVSKSRKHFLKNGLFAIQDKRKKNPKEILTRTQREEIINIVKTKSPRNYDYESKYWTTSIVSDLILRNYRLLSKPKNM